MSFASSLPHVWWGVSVEDRRYGLPRVAELRDAPAAVRFLSVEPLLEDLGELDLRGIDWVIVGGESGHGARPLRPEWARSVRDQCQAAGVAFFFKQWGGVRKGKTGRTLDGRLHDDMPERAAERVPGLAVRRSLLQRIGANDKEQLVPLRVLEPTLPSTTGSSTH